MINILWHIFLVEQRNIAQESHWTVNHYLAALGVSKGLETGMSQPTSSGTRGSIKYGSQ